VTEVVMLTSLSGALRAALVLMLSAGYVVSDVADAYAQEGEDDDEGGDDSGDDGGEDAGEDASDGEDDKDQPSVTSGGLYTIKTYPVRELLRPLTMTQGITQLRAATGVDVSDKTAFEYAGVTLDMRHGLKDNFTLLAGFGGDYNFNAFDVNAGFEGALVYDLLDIKVQARASRAAVASRFDDLTGKPTHYTAGAGTQFSVDLGFPFRYVARPEIAIIALDTLISFDLNSIERGDPSMATAAGRPETCFAPTNTMDPDKSVDRSNCLEDGSKPDLNPSLGIATNPVAPLDVRIFVQLQIRDFDTTNQFVVPATARVQFAPTQKLDFGLEFKFLDVKPKDPDGDGPQAAGKFYDNRFMNLFMQARF
jgi:hypothetical protein